MLLLAILWARILRDGKGLGGYKRNYAMSGAGVGGRSAAGTAVSARSEHSGVHLRAGNDENARKKSVGDTSTPKIDPPSSCTAVHKLFWATQSPVRSLSTAAPHTQTGLWYFHISLPFHFPDCSSGTRLHPFPHGRVTAVSVTVTPGHWICSEMSLKSTPPAPSVLWLLVYVTFTGLLATYWSR